MAVMEEDGRDSYYLQDDLGSPMQLMGEEGEIRETYGFDEFGLKLDDRPEKQIRPYGYTGYQVEAAGGRYFAQARRYDAGAGRFVSEDKIPGFTSRPYTLNRYDYCWNQPMEHVDLNGEFPWILIPLVLGLPFVLGGCGNSNSSELVEYPMPGPGNHEYKYTVDDYNSPEYCERTNCYAYAFDIIDNPVTGYQLYARGEDGVFAAQPGLFSGQYNPYDISVISGTDEGNQKLVELVKDDAKAMGLSFQEYKPDMSGGYAVLLVINPYEDYHWYRQETDGTWSHKVGNGLASTGVVNPVQNAKELGYTTVVGYYYIKGVCDGD